MDYRVTNLRTYIIMGNTKLSRRDNVACCQIIYDSLVSWSISSLGLEIEIVWSLVHPDALRIANSIRNHLLYH